MTTEQKKRFTVISNNDFNHSEKERHRAYQTNPLKEKLMKFANEECGKKFSVEDLLKW